MNMAVPFPFSAIVGQEGLKLALVLNAINPGCGGVLIRGEKGTAKSTAVRALAELLPEIEMAVGCRFALSPDEAASLCPSCRLCPATGEVIRRKAALITLPLNATEDRVAGGIDFEATTRNGVRTVLPGLLAQAHRGLLYVDEVNLLNDHLVDAILSAAASGVNRIEREGVSFRHPSRFILVGTMNPEEGELRPQFLDRFGLCVEVRAEAERERRVLTMEQRERFDADPGAFAARFRTETQALAQRIVAARRLLPTVRLPGHLRVLIGELATEVRVAGHRADLVIEQTARAHAAYAGRTEVEESDITTVATLALRHRRREPAPPPPPEEHQHDHSHDQEPPEDNDDQKKEEQSEGKPKDGPPPPQKSQSGENQEESAASGGAQDDSREPDTPVSPEAREKIFEVGATFKVKPFAAPKDKLFRRGSGRRSRSRVSGRQGRYVKSTLPRGTDDVALDATLRAAAPHQLHRKSGCAIALHPSDLREKVRERRLGNFLLFVVDASGSMGARGRMTATKGAILSLLLDAYQKRDKVAMIAFAKTEARLVLPPTSSIDVAARLLADLPVGGRTPLNEALVKADGILRSQLVRDPTARPIAVLITDGRSNVALGNANPVNESLELARRLARKEQVRFILVDTEEQGLIRFGLAAKIAAALNARYCKTEDLKADTLLELIRKS